MNTIIPTALEYFDKNKKNINKKEFKYLKIIEATDENEHNIIKFYDENEKEILTSRYEIAGIYYTRPKIWIWGWGDSNLSKNKTIIIRKLFNYAFTLTDKEKSLKKELITSRFKINNYIQLDIHIALATYLTKKPTVYKYKITSNMKTTPHGNMLEILNNEEVDTIYYMFLIDV